MKHCVRLQILLLLFFCTLSPASELRLQRMISKPLSGEIPIVSSKRSIPFADAVISANRPDHWSAEMPRKLHDALAKAWGKDQAPPVVDAETARKCGKTVLLIGDGFSNDLAGQLQILPLIGDSKVPEGELRVIPGAPSDRPEILYFGGATPEALDGRIREFLRRYPIRPAAIPFFVDCVNPELRFEF